MWAILAFHGQSVKSVTNFFVFYDTDPKRTSLDSAQLPDAKMVQVSTTGWVVFQKKRFFMSQKRPFFRVKSVHRVKIVVCESVRTTCDSVR